MNMSCQTFFRERVYHDRQSSIKNIVVFLKVVFNSSSKKIIMHFCAKGAQRQCKSKRSISSGGDK